MDADLQQKSLNLLRTALQDPTADFRAGQWDVIEQLVNEKAHLLVVQRTGWGKSIVYFISGSGDKRGHGKTPLFMAGMECLPLCKVPLLPIGRESF